MISSRVKSPHSDFSISKMIHCFIVNRTDRDNTGTEIVIAVLRRIASSARELTRISHSRSD